MKILLNWLIINSIFFTTASASFIGSIVRYGLHGIISGSFGTGFISEEYSNETGNNTSVGPKQFGTAQTMSGRLKGTPSSSEIPAGELLITYSLTAVAANTSILKFSFQRVQTNDGSLAIRPIFNNVLQP